MENMFILENNIFRITAIYFLGQMSLRIIAELLKTAPMVLNHLESLSN